MLEVNEFNLSSWTYPRALARLLFEGEKVGALSRQITNFFEKGKFDSDQFSKENGVALKQLLKTKEAFPGLHVSLKQPPILWVRFGFLLQQRGIGLSDRYLMRYAEWRDQCSKNRGGTMVRWITKSPANPENKQISKFQMDYFLHAPDLSVSIEAEQVIRLDHDPRREVAKPGRHVKMVTEDHVGVHAMKVIEECIYKAAFLGSIKGLTSERDIKRERFICHLKREELAKALSAKFSEARQFSLTTIVRTVGDFAACSRPRRP